MPRNHQMPRLISAASVPVKAPRLLLVDDDRVMRELMREALQHQGYHVEIAHSAEEALSMLGEQADRCDAVILDHELPGMKGLQVVEKMKSDPDLSAIPVIMLTSSDRQQDIQEGIDAGVYYYLVKPADQAVLRSVIEAALRERRRGMALIGELNRHGGALKAMRSCQLAVRTLEEAEDTACLLASCFPDPERVVTGLMELLSNAVEHGILGMTHEEKHHLLAQDGWREEIERRAALPENAAKFVDVIYQRKDVGYLVQINDGGAGFDWRRYWHINPGRATSSHGRGIARARLMAFDRMAYNESGNSVTVMVTPPAPDGQDYAW